MASLCLLGEDGTTAGRWELGDQPLAVGREDSADIIIDDETLSRRHFVIQSDGTHYHLIDLESENGTFVDGKPVRQTPIKLEHHFCIAAGRSLFMFNQPHP
jgi:pSer/pThr/pTyr-binding forkhead associated (FHA) protein